MVESCLLYCWVDAHAYTLHKCEKTSKAPSSTQMQLQYTKTTMLLSPCLQQMQHTCIANMLKPCCSLLLAFQANALQIPYPDPEVTVIIK